MGGGPWQLILRGFMAGQVFSPARTLSTTTTFYRSPGFVAVAAEPGLAGIPVITRPITTKSQRPPGLQWLLPDLGFVVSSVACYVHGRSCCTLAILGLCRELNRRIRIMSSDNRPMTAVVEFQIRPENTTMEEWLDEWQKRAEDALEFEPETTAYEACYQRRRSNPRLDILSDIRMVTEVSRPMLNDQLIPS